MLRMRFLAVALALNVGCAQVPKESVELSATVGRDIAEVHQSHRQTTQLLFGGMRRDINRFVDEVYAPFQINFVMQEEQRKANSADAADRRTSILLLINAAFKPDASPALQDTALKAMDILVTKIRDDIESKRRELLAPLDAQEAEVLGSIDRAYQKIHHANSIVTGHLASVARVHEAQDEILNAIGVERNLRQEIGVSLANASGQIGEIVAAAEKADKTLDEAKVTAEKLKEKVTGIVSTVAPTN